MKGATHARAVLGHVTGMALSILSAAFAPPIVDAVACVLAALGLVRLADGCAIGPTRTTVGELSLTWGVAMSLLGLVGIMEVAMWLRRWYRAPNWSPPLVVLGGCPLLLAAITYFNEPSLQVGLFVGAAMGIPVALAFTAYWVPLAFWRRQ